MSTKKLPRGIANNNPGNIRHGDQWQGMAKPAEQKDRDFVTFTSASWGIRAMARTLISYKDKHGLNTVRGIINRWAPPVENNTGAYVNHVAALIGVSPDSQVDVYDYGVMRPLVEAIIKHENGPGPLKNANTWYDDTTVIEGLKLAGVVKADKGVMATPEGKAGAVAVGAGGGAAIIGTLADLGPTIAGHVSAANAATNGLPTWVRVLIIGLTLVAVGAGAYMLLQKRKEQKATE